MKSIDGNLNFEQKPRIASYASAVGKKEGEGPLREYFDRVIHDSYAGRDTFEQAESELMNTAVQLALNKGHYTQQEIDLACCGDLLNQCVASSFAMRRFAIPYAGVYGACSTMALSMILSAIAVESGAVNRAICAASSHYCTAERQYRFPLEYGSQRPPTAQWTVTGAGACIIEKNSRRTNHPSVQPSAAGINRDPARKEKPDKDGINTGENSVAEKSSDSETNRTDDCLPVPTIYAARLGRIIDYNITDQNNMGVAMAPAVVKLGTISNLAKTA